ncbi:MAG: TlpA family protein disulfide reductase [Chloroflexi bacterium]|nr:TlpA family protein disulfide reductase [Chloroflexota bacterium]MBU1749979.1 TlpA family protein disulfide reductase [Chloroflexota bacterium]MBU1877890.1 TlpA family protein disulfide reductase [Chloroflexota bacterium]
MSNSRTSTRKARPARRRVPVEILIIVGLVVAVGVLGGLWYFVWQPALAAPAIVPAPSAGAEPEMAPDFALQDLAGKTVHLSDYRGQAVVLNTWATWCGPCRAEMPDLEKLSVTYADRGLVVLAVNVGESQEQVAAFIQEQGYTLPVLLDTTAEAVAYPYRVRGIPTTFFIDREGRIVDTRVGAMSLAEMEQRAAAIL